MKTKVLNLDYNELGQYLVNNYLIDECPSTLSLSMVCSILNEHLDETFNPEGRDPDPNLTEMLLRNTDLGDVLLEFKVGSVVGAVTNIDDVVIKLPLIFLNTSELELQDAPTRIKE